MPMATIIYRKDRNSAFDASFQVKLDATHDVGAQRPSFYYRQSPIRCRVGVQGVDHPRVSIV